MAVLTVIAAILVWGAIAVLFCYSADESEPSFVDNIVDRFTIS